MLNDALTPSLETTDRIGDELRAHERQGNYRAAKRLLRRLIRYDAATVGGRAGHVIRWADHPDFWEHLLKQVAEACEKRCDGYALRGVEGPPLSPSSSPSTTTEGISA